MDANRLAPWSPNDYLISRLPFAHDADARCPRYEQFMQETFKLEPDPEAAINTYEEFVAHTLFECLDYQRFLVLKGPPATGKSTLIKIARAMHGPNAVSAVPVQEFGNERYRTAMVGRLLNVVNEVQATSHAADDFLKSVTAGDEVQVRYLYQEPVLVRLPTRVLIACNEMFRIRDTSGAVERRMLVLSCDNMVPEDERDPRLPHDLMRELPGIFNRMVDAWQRLQKRGQFKPPASHVAQIDEFSLENNHVWSWVKERTHQGLKHDDPEYEMPPGLSGTEVGSLYYDYAEWSKMNGFKQISSITFGMKLQQIGRRVSLDLDVRVKKIGPRSIRVRLLDLLTEGRY